MKQQKTSPPAWAQQLLTWYCRPELLEDLQGDLNEYFDRNLKRKGLRKAKLIYIIDVFKFFRLYTVRRPEFINLLTQWIMLHSYIKTSGRSIMRHKLFSAINIFGLAISMSVGLLLIGMLNDMHSYDQFHEHGERIHRVISRYQFLDNSSNDFMASASLHAGKAIKETISGVEDVAMLRRGFRGDFEYNTNKLPLNGYWANESFFNVLTFPLLKGNPATALKEPYSVVLTETSAEKIFGKEDAFGKTLTLGQTAYTITGIMKDIPTFSHVKFEILGSLATWEILQENNTAEWGWANVWDSWVYVLMKEGTDLQIFKLNLDKLSQEKDKTVANIHIELSIQPVKEIITGESYRQQIGRTIGTTLTWVFSGLAFVVILSACFNYINLSIARSLGRSREIGIRKVVGARKSHVIGQFIAEAVIISLLSLIVAFLIFMLVKPHFLGLHEDLHELLKLDLSLQLILSFFAFAIFIGLIAGFFPALFFSKINAVNVLRNATAIRLRTNISGRKVLIVFQYCLSLMLIVGTLIMHEQYKHFLKFDLGFDTENILNIPLQGNNAAALKKALHELPEVSGIAQSVLIPGVGNYWGAHVRNPLNPEDSAFLFANIVDEHYLPLHNYELVAGRNFLPLPDSAQESEVIVNEAILKRFNLAQNEPSKAIGEILKVDGRELKIVGVMKDFQYGKASNRDSKEVMYRYSGVESRFLNVKLQSDDLPATYAKLESIWKKFDTVHPFNAKFYDEAIEESFKGILASMKLSGFIAFLAVCIASLGLLGMVVFTTETRLKEISIRKVLGADEGGLVFLLGRGFFVILGIAAGIALPLTYLFFDRIMLQRMANHKPLTVIDGLIGIVTVMTIAAIMIGSQTLRAARTNPAEILKND